MGPWKDTKVDLNPEKGLKKPMRAVKGQNSFVIKTAKADGTDGYVFVSDLWSTAADNLKSHDLQFW